MGRVEPRVVARSRIIQLFGLGRCTTFGIAVGRVRLLAVSLCGVFVSGVLSTCYPFRVCGEIECLRLPELLRVLLRQGKGNLVQAKDWLGKRTELANLNCSLGFALAVWFKDRLYIGASLGNFD